MGRRFTTALLLLACTPAFAQERIVDRVESAVTDAAKLLDLVGEKAGRLVGPGLGLGNSDPGGFVATRDFEQTYPAGPNATVSVTNEFGEIRITTWDNPIVKVAAKITVNAESTERAAQIAQNLLIQVDQPDNQTIVRTVRPDMRGEGGSPTISVDYAITVPRTANVVLRNDFGDAFAVGLGGSLAVDVSYGAVDLRDVGGPAIVRTRGEFAVHAEGLKQGGTFELSGAPAEFVDVAGLLKVGNFRGAVTLRNLQPTATVDVVSEAGPINLILAEGALPDLTATALSGEIQSDLPISQVQQAGVTVARSPNSESTQRISLRATLANILIQQQNAQNTVPSENAVNSQPFKETLTLNETTPENPVIKVDALTGNIRMVGIDANEIHVTATRLVRVQSQSNARAALEALDVQLAKSQDGPITLKTSLRDNMPALGCSSYRVDLSIECPRTAAIEVQAQDGLTSIDDTGGTLVVRQVAGAITAEHAKGQMDLTNQKGDVAVTSCAGPIQISAAYGTVTVKDVYASTKVTCVQGKTIVEAHHGDLYIRNTGGDVRVLSLDGVGGNYDIMAEQGNIGVLLPPQTDASLSLTADNGIVRSAIPLTGNIGRNNGKAFAEYVKLNTGPYRVTLQTKNGDISID